MLPFFNYVDGNHDAIREMLLHPAGVLGTVRRRRPLLHDLRRVVSHVHADALGARSSPRARAAAGIRRQKQSHDTAQLFGLSDRGVIEVGKKADVNVIDFDALTLHMPRMAYDLPAGGAPARAGRLRLRRHDRQRRRDPTRRRRHRRAARPVGPRRALRTYCVGSGSRPVPDFGSECR